MTLDETKVLRAEINILSEALRRIVTGGDRVLKEGTDDDCRQAMVAAVEIAEAALAKLRT